MNGHFLLKSKQSFNVAANNSIHFSYLKFTWKRCFMRLSKIFLGLIILIFLCFFSVYAFSFFSKKDTPAASSCNVVFVMPKNAGLHYTLALGMVSDMDSLSSMVTIKKTTSEEEARRMLQNKEVSAAVIIPEGMIHTIISGSNELPARIIYPGEPGIETLIFRQIIDNLSSMVASSQIGIYSLYDIYELYGADENKQTSANSRLNELYINQVLNRSDIFCTLNASSADEDSFFTEDHTSLIMGYICSGLALLFLLAGINFSFILSDHDVSHALKRIGLSHYFQTVADFSAAWFCQSFVFFICIIFIASFITATSESFSYVCALFAALVCSAFSCAMQLFICRFFRVKQFCIIASFLLSFAIMYFSGCLIPAAFLPDSIRMISSFLPGSILKNIILGNFNGQFMIFDSLVLVGEALLMIAIVLLHMSSFKLHIKNISRYGGQN